jgi:hypothetical protein
MIHVESIIFMEFQASLVALLAQSWQLHTITPLQLMPTQLLLLISHIMMLL